MLGVYFRHIEPADLAEHEAQDLLGALVAHWRLMRQRLPTQSLVRVYNPDQEEHGWRSDDTIVEIAVEDGRFTTLVAAVQAAGLVDLVAEGFELAIRIGSLRDSSLIASKIADVAAKTFVAESMDRFPNMTVELGARIGELDEEFVWENGPGSRFVFGG